MGFDYRQRSIWVGLILCFYFFGTGGVNAQVDGWQATYWNNTDLEGAPVLQQLETDQNHNPELKRNWGNSPPWPQVENDYFSARYERTLTLQPGRYRFAAAADDGVRVWVNDNLIIDEWINQVPTTHIGYFDQSSAKPVTIRVEYFDRQHGALLTVTWDRIYGSDSAVTGSLYQPTITGWKGEYFNNRIVAGVPAIVRNDEQIDFNWGLDTPVVEAVNADGFSVRWSRTLNLPAGTWRFKTETDDGVRLKLNGRLAIDQWNNQVFSPHTTDLNHAGGPVAVVMEYYDEIGLAQARLTWEQIGAATASSGNAGPAGYWQAAYYNNTNFASTPAVTRVDNAIDFDWGKNAPARQIIREAFAVRWTGTLDLPAGEYRFTTTSDDGVRLWVNNQIVIDKWNKQPTLVYSAEVSLPSGRVPIKMEYYNAEDKAVAKLDWERLDGDLPAGNGLVPVTSNQLPVTSGGSASIAEETAVATPENSAVVKVATLNVRTQASILSEVQTKVSGGDVLPIVGRNRFNNWLQVELPDKSLGWVSILYITLPDDRSINDFDEVSNPTTAVTLDGESAAGEPFGKINSRLNVIRTEPSYLAPKIKSLAPGTEVVPTGRNAFNNWVQITLPDGSSGWVGVLFIDLNVPVTALPEVGGR